MQKNKPSFFTIMSCADTLTEHRSNNKTNKCFILLAF